MVHSCIKCKTQYESDDIDAYYCPACVEIKKQLAKEIDAKIQARPQRETKSALQQYDEAVKVRGFMHVRL